MYQISKKQALNLGFDLLVLWLFILCYVDNFYLTRTYMTLFFVAPNRWSVNVSTCVEVSTDEWKVQDFISQSINQIIERSFYFYCNLLTSRILIYRTGVTTGIGRRPKGKSNVRFGWSNLRNFAVLCTEEIEEKMRKVLYYCHCTSET